MTSETSLWEIARMDFFVSRERGYLNTDFISERMDSAEPIA